MSWHVSNQCPLTKELLREKEKEINAPQGNIFKSTSFSRTSWEFVYLSAVVHLAADLAIKLKKAAVAQK